MKLGVLARENHVFPNERLRYMSRDCVEYRKRRRRRKRKRRSTRGVVLKGAGRRVEI